MEKRKEENARKAKEAAGLLFPGEKWKKWEDGIYVAERRKRSGKSNFADELRDAQILRDAGGTVYLIPEDTRNYNEPQYDAIVNGYKMELKNMDGNSDASLIEHFYRSRRQAPNVFFNLEKSPISKGRAIRVVYGARNSPEYEAKNKFPEGGIIIFRFRGNEDLFYYDVDDILEKNTGARSARNGGQAVGF